MKFFKSLFIMRNLAIQRIFLFIIIVRLILLTHESIRWRHWQSRLKVFQSPHWCLKYFKNVSWMKKKTVSMNDFMPCLITTRHHSPNRNIDMTGMRLKAQRQNQPRTFDVNSQSDRWSRFCSTNPKGFCIALDYCSRELSRSN